VNCRTDQFLLAGSTIVIDGRLDYDTRVRLAGSVDSIKGYSEIKERAVVEWRAEVRRLVDGWEEICGDRGSIRWLLKRVPRRSLAEVA